MLLKNYVSLPRILGFSDHNTETTGLTKIIPELAEAGKRCDRPLSFGSRVYILWTTGQVITNY